MRRRASVVWRKKLGSPLRAAPTVADGVIYFTGSGNAVFALRASDGSEVWNYKGTGGGASIIGSPSPAVASGFVVMPTTTGEIDGLHGERRAASLERFAEPRPIR